MPSKSVHNSDESVFDEFDIEVDEELESENDES